MKIGLIGCVRMGAFTSKSVTKHAPKCWFPLSHIESIMEHPELSLISICDNNHDQLNNAGDTFSVERRYSNHIEMIKDNDLDILCLATRTDVKTAIIIDAFEHGIKNMHVEKPLCNSYKQLERIEDIFKQDFYCTLGTIRRHFEVYKKAKKLLLSKQFGKLQQIHVNMGKGRLLWTHPHSIDLILFFADNRELVHLQSFLDAVEIDRKTVLSDPIIKSAILAFSDGVTGHINQIEGCDVHLICSEGQITIHNDGAFLSSKILSNDDPYLLETEKYDDDSELPQGTYRALDFLIKSRSQQNNSLSMDALKEDIVIGQKVIFGLVQSHLNGNSVISINDLDKDLSVIGRTGEFVA